MEYYPRKIEEKLERWLHGKEAIIIRGPRQSGKTTLLLHLKDKHGGHYVTLEDEDALRSFESAPKEFASRFLEEGRTNLFIDEAQYSKKAGKVIKLLFDLFSDRLKIFVTGSGSFDVKVEIGKYLVGRAVYFELLPLDFEEFLLWKARDLHKVFCMYREAIREFFLDGKIIDVSPAFESEFKSLLQEYLIFGGFPAIVKVDDEETKKELLKNLVRTYMEKDVFFFFNVRQMEKFRSLITYLALNSGSLLEISSVSRELRMDYKTIESYISVLVSTGVINLISPFHRNLTTELKKSKKAYFVDTGLRNAVIGNFLSIESRTDKGILLENFVLNELKSLFTDRLNYWRTTGKAEVDFVLNLEDKIIPVEVKSTAKMERGFLSFLKTYKPSQALVVSDHEFKIVEIERTKVAFIPHFFV
ncbi:MAG: ATP-binding protein [Metallosphaera sp.]|uniref:ATP-binding protein n=1 Tax=Metallosphaera sp. TaxID=2020860 RepID=UPI0031640F6E